MSTRFARRAHRLLPLLAVAACAGHRSLPTDVVGSPRQSPTSPVSVVDTGIQGTTMPRSPEIIRGSGVLINPAASHGKQAPAAAKQGFQLNFVDTDIATVISAVLGDGLGLPYLIDPRIKGTMTLQATRPLGRDEVLSALEAALHTQSIAMIEKSGVYHIIPEADAFHQVGPLALGEPHGRGFGVDVVPLRFIGAADMRRILQPFAPEGGIVQVDEARNLLVLAGTSEELATMLGVIKTFDVDWLAGMSFAMFPLEYADAKTLTSELSEVFSGDKSPIAGVVRLVPLERLNSILVITPQARYLTQVEDWIKRLDLGETTPGRRIYVYDVQNGKASDLARTLSSILSIPYDSGDESQSGPGGLGQSTLSGPSMGLGAGFGLGAGTGLSTSPGLGSGNSFGGSSMFQAGGPATRYAPGASSVPSSRESGAGGAQGTTAQSSSLAAGSLKIVPSDENNSLLILATPSEFTVIDAALKRLDVAPLQVLIEASIAEVSLTDNLQYGLQWAYQSGSGPIVFSGTSAAAVAQQFPGFSYLYKGSQSIQAVLNAIETLTTVRVLSAPKLLVLNDRQAQLQVGDEVPVAVQSSIATTAASAPIVNSVQLEDTGVILAVTPRANRSGQIFLDLDQEVSDATNTTSSQIDSPTIEQRRITTTVEVHDGQTIALGGLISDSDTAGGNGIPYLRRIPLLGHLFGSTTQNHDRTELIVLITPHILRSDRDSAGVMRDLQEEFKGLRRFGPVHATHVQ